MATNNSADISGLIESIKSSGLAFSNRFEVTISPSPKLRGTDLSILRSISMRCDSVTMPGRGFSTTPYRFYGPARNMPYEPIYSGELTLSVILSADLRERNFFETWMQMVCDPNNYKFGYYDDYVGNLTINPLTRTDAISYQMNVEEVYPKSLGDLQVGYDRDNDYLKQEITLAFRKYTAVYTGVQQVPEQFGPPLPTPTSPEQAMQRFVNNGGRIDRVGLDGSVNGFYGAQSVYSSQNGISP